MPTPVPRLGRGKLVVDTHSTASGAPDDQPASTSQPDPPIPEGFTVRTELGRGSTSVVWLATYEVTGQDVALKVWRHPLSTEADRERFVSECHWHGLLSDHPNIVDWVWAGESDASHPWTATGPHGESLARWLRTPHNGAERLQVALDVVDGLAAMHRHNLVHRDINPNNVLVNENGVAALCDLGIALPVDRATGDNAAGTPGFVAPELRSGDASPSLRSDVYAAARTIQPLFEDAPQPVRQTLTRAASLREQDRPADASDFGEDLRAAAVESGLAPADPRPVQSTPNPTRAVGDGDDPQRGAPRSRRRGPALIAAGLVAVVGVLAGGGWLLLGGAADESEGGAASLWTEALAQNPDVDEQGRPVRLAPKTSEPCPTDPVATEAVTDAQGQPVGHVSLALEKDGKRCAMFSKAEGSQLVGTRSFLAVSLCNSQGVCDHDWNDFKIFAGPVKVPTEDGCVHWRASAMDEGNDTWLVQGQQGTLGCD